MPDPAFRDSRLHRSRVGFTGTRSDALSHGVPSCVRRALLIILDGTSYGASSVSGNLSSLSGVFMRGPPLLIGAPHISVRTTALTLAAFEA
jgi:hypothetical protein